MSLRKGGNREEPVRTRKASMKDKNKTGVSDIQEAFKMAADKKKIKENKTDSTNMSKENGGENNASPMSPRSNDKTIEVEENSQTIDTAEGDPTSHESHAASIVKVKGVDAMTQVCLEDLPLNDGFKSPGVNVGISVDSEKQEILDALRELSTKFTTLDNIINHPKQGLGSQMVSLTLRGDNFYTDVHGAANGLLVRVGKLESKLQEAETTMKNFEESQKRLTTMLAENKRLSQDLVTTQGLIQKYSQKIAQLEQKVMDLTRRGMEQNLLIHAIEEVSVPQNENCQDSVIKFLQEFLQVQIDEADIWKCYRMGVLRRARSRPMFVKLSFTAKDKIMDKVGLLKGKRNANEQAYFISEQVPEGVAEVRKQTSKRASALKKVEEKRPADQRREVKVVGDKILVGGSIDKPEVSTPQPFELFPGVEEQKKIHAVAAQIKESQPAYLRNSTFVGLAAKVHSVEQVNLAYKAVMQRFPFMDHTMAAYRFKDNHDNFHYGSCDDNEHGGGAAIARFLQQNQIKDTAVFVVRRYGGLHLGYDRFKAIEESAEAAIKLLDPNFEKLT